jgi:hypothetical protein
MYTCTYVVLYVCVYVRTIMYECIYVVLYVSVYVRTIMYECIYVVLYVSVYVRTVTAIPIIIEGRFQGFQRFSSSKLVLKTVESCFAALNYYGNGSTSLFHVL